MDLLLAGYGSSDDEDETQKEDVTPESTSAPGKSSTLFSKLPPPSSSSSSSASTLFSRLPAPSASATSSTAKSASASGEATKGGKRTVSLMLPIPKEALRDDYEDEFMRSNGPALPEAPKATGLSALLPAPKNPNPAKRPRLAPPSVTRRQAEGDADKPAASSSATTTTKPSAEVPQPAATATTASSTASRAPARSLRAVAPQPSTPAPAPAPAPAPVAAADPSGYTGAEAYQHGQYYDQQQQQQYYYGQDPSGAYAYAGYEQAGYGYAQQQPQEETPQYLPQDLPEPPPEFTREWAQLARGAKIVDVNQAQITDTSGWSKEFIQQNLAKASSGVSAKDRPGGVQRRKHQITSLAFEAKQRELELLNQRASAQRTKAETWGKYGW